MENRWQRVADLIGSGFESHTSCTWSRRRLAIWPEANRNWLLSSKLN